MSDTPLTDERTHTDNYPHYPWVYAEFARLLEMTLAAERKRIPRWTPTSDLAALPPLDTYVIVHSRSGVTSMMHRSRHGRGGWAWREHFKTWAQSEITHWMPKPEAPEKEVAK